MNPTKPTVSLIIATILKSLKPIGALLFSLLKPITLWGFTVILDPGHGGNDHGATQGPIIESKLAFQIAQRVAKKFEGNPHTKVILTRAQNHSVSLKERTQLAHSQNADLFVSLHGNSSSDPRAKGTEFYIGTSLPPRIDQEKTGTLSKIIEDLHFQSKLYQSQALASKSYQTWLTSKTVKARAIRQAPFYVINRNKVPSILVELGFITNPTEAGELQREDTQNNLAENIYGAIEAYRTQYHSPQKTN